LLRLIRQVDVFAPEPLGVQDVLIGGGKILEIASEIRMPQAHCEVIPGEGLWAVPGFVDGHVHLIGGGGEGGWGSRTPELPLSDAIRGGVTTLVGCLGTDGITRTLAAMLAKTRQLDAEGLTAYMFTGHYGVPVRTLTGGVEEDLLFIDKVIGVGEVAISDHRSSQPTFEELARIAGDARRGGILSGKAGLVDLHLGDGDRKLDLLLRLIRETELPPSQFLPTHVNRNEALFESAMVYAGSGGYVDLTTSTVPQLLERGEVKASRGLARLLRAGIPPERITFTSDGQGSLPSFDDQGRLKGLSVGRVTSLFDEVRDAVMQDGVSFDAALKVVTSSPADLMKLAHKGRIEPGRDADIVLLRPEGLAIDTVVARGRVLMQGRSLLPSSSFAWELGHD
jgi:beta-aspartyl-dipeptidase (metallo-type)